MIKEGIIFLSVTWLVGCHAPQKKEEVVRKVDEPVQKLEVGDSKESRAKKQAKSLVDSQFKEAQKRLRLELGERVQVSLTNYDILWVKDDYSSFEVLGVLGLLQPDENGKLIPLYDRVMGFQAYTADWESWHLSDVRISFGK